MPMVVALLPLLKGPDDARSRLLLPAHFTAATMWVESLRLLPGVPRERRDRVLQRARRRLLGVCPCRDRDRLLSGRVLAAVAHRRPLFLTPISFLVSTTRNARFLVDRLALGLGLVLGPALAWAQVGLDLLWTGIVAGTVAYGLHRLREALR